MCTHMTHSCLLLLDSTISFSATVLKFAYFVMYKGTGDLGVRPSFTMEGRIWTNESVIVEALASRSPFEQAWERQ